MMTVRSVSNLAGVDVAQPQRESRRGNTYRQKSNSPFRPPRKQHPLYRPQTLVQEQTEVWVWRIPFLVAGPLGAVAVYFYTNIEESAPSKPRWKPKPSRSGQTPKPGKSSALWAQSGF